MDVAPGAARFHQPEAHRRVARLASSRMTKDTVQWAKRHVPVRTGRLKSSIKRRRTRHGSDVYIDFSPTRKPGKSNASTGRYWLWLLGTDIRYIKRGSVYGPDHWPKKNMRTGRIKPYHFDEWFERIDHPNLILFNEWYVLNARNLLRGRKLTDPH